MKKLFSLCLILCILLSTPILSAVPGHASAPTDDTIVFVEPRFSNVISTETGFTITNTGLAGVSVIYTGIQGVTTRVMCKIYLEKKVLGLFWTRVDLGNTNDEWIDTSTEVIDRFSHTFQLESTGTYRAVFYIPCGGTNGPSDIVEQIIEKKYSR